MTDLGIVYYTPKFVSRMPHWNKNKVKIKFSQWFDIAITFLEMTVLAIHHIAYLHLHCT